MPSVISCSGGYSLRTDTLIILYIPVVVYVLLVGFLVGVLSLMSGKMIDFSSIMKIVLIFALPLVIPTTAIYGVMKKKPSFMIPYLAFGIVSLGSVLFLMVMVAFRVLRAFIAGVSINIQITIDIDMIDMYKIVSLVNGFTELIEIYCLLLALGALHYYALAIVLTYYYELRREIKQTRQTKGKVFFQACKDNEPSLFINSEVKVTEN